MFEMASGSSHSTKTMSIPCISGMGACGSDVHVVVPKQGDPDIHPEIMGDRQKGTLNFRKPPCCK